MKRPLLVFYMALLIFVVVLSASTTVNAQTGDSGSQVYNGDSTSEPPVLVTTSELPVGGPDLVQPVIDSATGDIDHYKISESAANQVVLVRDEAGLFNATLHSEVRLQLLSLKRETAVELFLVTRIVPSLDEVEVIAYDLFRSLVREEGHYKIILVLVAIDPKNGQGTVSTNLGAGVYHLLDRKDCEGLFVRNGEPFSPEGVKQGVTFLREKIEGAFARDKRADVAAGNEDSQAGRDVGFFKYGYIVLLGALIVLGCGGFYLYTRPAKCPRCGELLKTKVNVVMGTGGSDMARKTYKCFACGYVKRRSLVPSTFIRSKE